MQYYIEEEAGALREAFEDEVLAWEHVSRRSMFGCPAYIVEGRLFAFLVTEGVVITQLRKRDRETLAEDYAIEPFQAGERTIERWVKIALPEPAGVARLIPYVRKSYQAVLTMA